MDQRQTRLITRLDDALSLMGTHRIADVIKLAHEHRAQIWEGADALVVTELIDHPLCRVVRYWCVAGSIDGVRALQPDIDRWAVKNGATRADAIGRRGWERVVGPGDWKHIAGYWHKDLIK